MSFRRCLGTLRLGHIPCCLVSGAIAVAGAAAAGAGQTLLLLLLCRPHNCFRADLVTCKNTLCMYSVLEDFVVMHVLDVNRSRPDLKQLPEIQSRRSISLLQISTAWHFSQFHHRTQSHPRGLPNVVSFCRSGPNFFSRVASRPRCPGGLHDLRSNPARAPCRRTVSSNRKIRVMDRANVTAKQQLDKG